jgi:hypothetical protein
MAGGGEHVVQFYDHDGDLARAVGDYLTLGVRDGGAAVVIATEAHCREFEAVMAASGVDTDRARRDGSVVWLDARARRSTGSCATARWMATYSPAWSAACSARWPRLDAQCGLTARWSLTCGRTAT